MGKSIVSLKYISIYSYKLPIRAIHKVTNLFQFVNQLYWRLDIRMFIKTDDKFYCTYVKMK